MLTSNPRAKALGFFILISLRSAIDLVLKLHFLLILILCSSFIQAQNSTDADSLFSKSENLLYKKPSESAKIAQFLFENSQNTNDKVKSLLLLTESNLLRGDYETAIEKLFLSMELSKKVNKKTNETQINALLQRLCKELGIEFSQLYLIADKIGKNDSIPNKTQEIEPYNSYLKSKKYFSEGNYNESTETLNQLKPFEKVQDISLREEIYKLSVQNFQELNDWEQYRINYQLQNALHDSLSLIKENARVLLLTKINQKQNEILTSKSQNHSQILYGISGAIILVLIPIYLINSKLDSQKKKIENSIKLAEEKEKFEAENKANESAGKIVIPDKTIDALLKKLEKFESKHEYLDASISLNSLAENLETNTKYLSEIINNHKNKNFHSYINELRINYIISKLKDNPIYLKYKVSHLAEEAGFSSHSLFSTVFKQVTGLSPAAFIKSIKNQDSDEK